MASDPSQAPPTEPPNRGASKRLPGILGASLLLLGGGGWVGYLQLGKAEPRVSVAPPADVEPGVVELEPFVLNLADPLGDRYLRLRMSLGLDRREVAERASAGLSHVKLRDRVLSVLAQKHASELASSAGKDELRAEIRASVEQLLSEVPFHVPATDEQPARVLEVFLTEFLLQ